ncbi:MAG: hypothetical protein IT464_11790 [Planctomycetes bacterium]|nr:hypothetical protein [Planctomycetota bacterium]
MKARFIPRALAAIALLCIAGGFSISQDSEFGPAKIAYDDYIKRPSLQMRTRGRVGLAKTQHKGAWDILTKSYAKPEAPKDHVKYLLASICAQYFGDEEWANGWVTWREANKKPEDAWLWYRGLIHHQQNRGEDDLIAIVSEPKNDLFLRAAAFEALAENGSEKILAWWETELDKAEKWKGVERAVLLECCAHNMATETSQKGTDQFRKTGLKLIPLIEEKQTDDRTKLVMARYFKEIFATDKLYVNAKPWLDLLLNPDKEPARDDKYAPAAPPTKFVGIESNGKRIVYVIDLSDSMMKPVSTKIKEEIKKPPEPSGPVTGSGEHRKPPGKDEGKKEEEKKEPEMEDELPWDKIKVRFHVAREYLKLSLKTLQPDQFYCVIKFGTNAELAKTTKGLTPATAANIQATIRELDAIKPGPGTEIRKDGTLMGDTNLHGGIHRAFKVTKGGMVKEFEYVDGTTWFDGADTIFILSDGDPTDDDWAQVDKRDPWDQTGDPETRTKAPDQENLRFPGPYGYWQYNGQGEFLVDDVRRLNVFRKCEIHCIGIGEATYSMLRGIANVGRGQLKMIGNGG